MNDDALVALETMLPQIDAALEGRRLGTSVERASERLSGARRQTERLEGYVNAAVLLGFGDDRESATSLAVALRKARHVAGAMTRAQTAPQLDEIVEMFRDFTNALNALEMPIRIRWRQVIETEFLPFVAVSEVLSRIPHFDALAASLSQFGSEARDAKERRTAPETLAAEISRLRAIRDRLDAELQSLTGDPEIDGFLKAVTAHRATLAMVTPPVMQWLAQHNALSTFTVGAGRS